MTRSGGQAVLPIPAGQAHAPIGICPWCHSGGKRTFDLLCAIVALAPALPMMLLIALVLKLTSKGPLLFRQKRVGKDGGEFDLLKFRTMTHRVPGPGLTQAGDARVTAIGRVLRKCKLDEVPQLFNLLRGDMSMVGPRPDLAEFLAALTEEQRQVLSLRPGITGWATLHYRHEEELLARVPVSELKQFYMREVLPEKIRLDLEYARRATLWSDLALVLRTAIAILR